MQYVTGSFLFHQLLLINLSKSAHTNDTPNISTSVVNQKRPFCMKNTSMHEARSQKPEITFLGGNKREPLYSYTTTNITTGTLR